MKMSLTSISELGYVPKTEQRAPSSLPQHLGILCDQHRHKERAVPFRLATLGGGPSQSLTPHQGHTIAVRAQITGTS